jgi:hypothetical protein
MAHLSAVPIRLNDGQKVNGLRVLELKAALDSFGVPESPGMRKAKLTR